MIMDSSNAGAESTGSGSDRSSNVSTSPPPPSSTSSQQLQQQQIQQMQQQPATGPSSVGGGSSVGGNKDGSPRDERGNSPMMNLINTSQHHAIITPTRGLSPPVPQTAPPVVPAPKVAAFMIAGDTMLCLPQAFELFLKHLVGGLHTVYTKLKRLDIVPLVCNVEQVRILRGMGAIQPGVNRCKLLSCKDFDTLYRDCTTA
ncbi:hypothetical protein AGLY_011844, partial [Aphis glycines]